MVYTKMSPSLLCNMVLLLLLLILLLLLYRCAFHREMENATGHVKFQNHYDRVHVQVSGGCKMWRSEMTSEDGGWLSSDVYVDIPEQKWHANLKLVNFFIPVNYFFIVFA